MLFRDTKKNDAAKIEELSRAELGWSSPEEHVEELLLNYPGTVALDDGEICGFLYSNPLSQDILKISNMVVSENCQKQGIGSSMLQHFEDLAAQENYQALLFSQNPQWFQKDSDQWLEKRGYSSIYATDHSKLLLKEME